MAYSSIITTLGAAKLATAMATGSAFTFSTMKVGDGGGNDVADPIDPATTDLVREVYASGINTIERDPSNPGNFIIEMIVPQDVGGWTVREVGVYDNAGDLVVYASFPASYKPLPSEGTAREMIIRVVVAVANAESISLTVNPTLVVATRDWVIQNFSVATLIPGGTTHQILAKKSNTDGDYQWVDPDTATAIVAVIEENQTLAAAQTVVLLTTATTENAAVYINGIRLRKDQWTATDASTVTLGTAATGGEKITIVQNDPTASADFLRVERNLGEIASNGAGAQLAARQNLGITEASSLLQQVLGLLYPVGEIIISRRTGAPNTWTGAWTGFGTWTPHGAGRTLVSLDSTDTDFDTIDKVGGEKAHKLLASELPSHTHSTPTVYASVTQSGTHSHTVNPPAVNTGSAGSHNHAYGHNDGQSHTSIVSGGGADWRDGPAGGAREFTDAAGAHTHTINIPAFDSAQGGNHTHTVTVPAMTTSGVGADLPHNNMPPYTVVNIWRRTA